MDRKFWLLRSFRFVLFAAIFIAVVGYVTMSLWNWLVPALFHGPFISLGQTFGLLVLSRILFGGFGGRRGGWAQRRRAWQQRMASRMAHLSPEEKEKFRAQMQQRCNMGWMRRGHPAEPAQQTA